MYDDRQASMQANSVDKPPPPANTTATTKCDHPLENSLHCSQKEPAQWAERHPTGGANVTTDEDMVAALPQPAQVSGATCPGLLIVFLLKKG